MSWSPSHLVVWPNSTSNAFPVGGYHGAVWQGHLPGEGPGGMGDDGDPVAASELDRVRVAVHVHVGEDGRNGTAGDRDVAGRHVRNARSRPGREVVPALARV